MSIPIAITINGGHDHVRTDPRPLKSRLSHDAVRRRRRPRRRPEHHENVDLMQRKTSHPKGRQAAASDLLAVDRYLAGKPVRRDLLIEYLHRIQDDVGHLPAGLLVALAERLRLAPVEVYEVASFYHHFDVVREGEDAPPKLTVRVCDSVGCAMQGAERLLDELTNAVGAGVRIQRVPCVGRCDAAPVVVVGRRPVPHADARRVAAAIDAGSSIHGSRWQWQIGAQEK